MPFRQSLEVPWSQPIEIRHERLADPAPALEVAGRIDQKRR